MSPILIATPSPKMNEMKFPFDIPVEAEFDVVGFGTNAVDHLIQVPEYPEFDSKIELLQYAREAGGEVATTVVGLQRLGLRTAYAGRFGNDAEGDFGLNSLIVEGVETTFAERISGASTQTAFILIDRATGERTVIWHRDRKLNYKAEDTPIAAARLCKVLHMTPHDLDACIRMAHAAKENGAVVSLDADRVTKGLELLLPLVDVLICADEFPRMMTQIREHDAALRCLRERFGCGVVGVTLGSEGSLLLCDGVLIATKARDVPGGCVDTTGAGDAFRTGFLFGLLTGKRADESAVAANTVAALSCSKLGARAGLPTGERLDGLIR